jgi:hypothetical protein
MATNLEFVSRIKNELKLLNKDDNLSSRFILQTGQNKCRTYMAQKMGDFSLFREANIITTIPCVELKRLDVKECPFLDFKRCDILMKSKKQMPELLYSRVGASILRVFNLDNSIDFSYASGTHSALRREFGGVDHKFYIRDNYLYIPNVEVHAVELEMITLDLYTADRISDCKKFNPCKSIWEYTFVCPDKLYELIVKETLAEIAQITRAIPEDENPNMDSNQKTQTKE